MADSYGARIRDARLKAGLKQAYVEMKMGFGGGYVSYYERNMRKPKLETLEKFAEVFGCDVLDLIPYRGQKSEYSNPYWERICAIAEKQREKGMDTYGQGLEDNPAEMMERIEHLQEELIDGLMYCEWIKEKFLEKGRI